jgi:hypothetical protein
MAHEHLADPLALIGRQRSHGVDIGRAQHRQAFRLEPPRRHRRVTDQFFGPVGEYVQLTGQQPSRF